MMTLLEHLQQRNYQLPRYTQTWIDEENRIVTVPLWNLSGILCGYQQYRPDSIDKKNTNSTTSRYHTVITRHTTAVWRAETIDSRPYVFVVEGIFDCCPIHALDEPAIALLGCTDIRAVDNLRLMGKDILMLCDGDKAGRRMSQFADKSVILADNKDPGDLSLPELANLLIQLQ